MEYERLQEIAAIVLVFGVMIGLTLLRSILRDKDRKVEEKKKELRAIKDKWKRSTRKS